MIRARLAMGKKRAHIGTSGKSPTKRQRTRQLSLKLVNAQSDFSEDDAAAITEQCRQAVAQSTIGFAKLSIQRNAKSGYYEEDAICAGSGTLVTLHGRRGILTAAHVLLNLPDSGAVGIIEFPTNPSRCMRRPTIKMELCSKFVLPGYREDAFGPDLGFLLIPDEDAGSLEARNTFINLDRRRGSALSAAFDPGYHVHGISGVVGEWETAEIDPERRTRRKMFGGLYGLGGTRPKQSKRKFDLLDVEVQFEFANNPPKSFQGMSGGGLWRSYLVKQDDGTWSRPQHFLIGVVFYELKSSNNRHAVRAHGSRSLYTNFFGYLKPKLTSRPPRRRADALRTSRQSRKV